MSADAIRTFVESLATLACQRPKKFESCTCHPCRARKLIVGANDPVQEQEPMRIRLATAERRVKDLAMLLRRLCAHPKSVELREKALGYLDRSGLSMNVLRADE